MNYSSFVFRRLLMYRFHELAVRSAREVSAAIGERKRIEPTSTRTPIRSQGHIFPYIIHAIGTCIGKHGCASES